MPPTPEQLLAALDECHALLRYTTERLDAITAALRSLPDAEMSPGVPYKGAPGHAETAGIPAEQSRRHAWEDTIPVEEPSGNTNPDSIPTSQSRRYLRQDAIPAGASRGNAQAGVIPGRGLPGNPPDSDLPSVGQLSAILKRDGFRTRTSLLHIRRAASLMLSLYADPGVRDMAFFARLMGLSYSGATKVMMELRREGFIHREKPQVHVLTEKGTALIATARGYAVPLD